jgi:hypothetical protein
MDGGATLEVKRRGLALLVLAATFGCGGSRLDKAPTTGAACCPGGGESVTSSVRARGFSAYEGRPVKAIFLYSGTTKAPMQETFVGGGGFDLDFPADYAMCADRAFMNGAGAITIDVDGDGVCNPAVDYVYAWSALGAAGPTCATLDLTPATPNCLGASGAVDFKFIEATTTVCPANDGCYACPGPSPDAGAVVGCLI